MENYALYIEKVILSSALLYIIYFFFLSKEVCFRANRYYLFGAMMFSLFAPLIDLFLIFIGINQSDNIYFINTNQTISQINSNAISIIHTDTKIGIKEILIIFLISGMIIFISRLIWQTIILVRIIAFNGIKKIDGLNIVENNKYGLSFSFFNIVFINPKIHNGNELSKILSHEKVHIIQKHWIDLLFIELLSVIFWFNPFVWLFERSIKQNHEYLADEGVLAQGHSVSQYQATLINQIMGMQIIGVTNNLNYSLNKKRMIMMTKSKSLKPRAHRTLWALPVVIALITFFAQPAYLMEQRENKTTNLNQDVQREIKVNGKILNEQGEPIPGANIGIDGTKFGTISNVEGTFTLLIAKTDRLIISFIGYEIVVLDFSSMEKAPKVNGVPMITITMALSKNVRSIIVNGKVIDPNGDPIPGANVIIFGTQIGTITNEKGLFNLKIAKQDKLIVSFFGFKEQVIDFKTIEKSPYENNCYSPTIKMGK